MIVIFPFEEKYYNKDRADDVIIGQILSYNNVKCHKKDTSKIYYNWNWNKEYNDNVKSINNNKNIVIRLMRRSPKYFDEYEKVSNKLIKSYYK